MRVAPALLAAGAGSRVERPKALVDWLLRSVGVLVDGGCASITVVLGASADEARGLLAQASFAVPPQVVVACDWAGGLSASLREGLRVLVPGRADAALMHLVDLPDLTAEVVQRVVTVASGPSARPRMRDGRPLREGSMVDPARRAAQGLP